MYVLNFDMIQSACLGVLVFLLGKFIIKKVPFFNRFCIPAPVIGGLLFCIIHLIGRQTGLLLLNLKMHLKISS